MTQKSRSRYVRLASMAAGTTLWLAGAQGQAQAAPHVPREVVVAFKPQVSQAQRDRLRRSVGIDPKRTISASSQSLTIRDGRGVKAVVKRLNRDPRVAHAHPNYVASVSGFIPNDPGRGGPGDWRKLQWNFAGEYGIRVEDAWQNTIKNGRPGGKGVLIAQLDTGIAYRNSRNRKYRRSPDLRVKQFVSGYDFVARSRFPYDRNGHGTFVAGTLAQHTNNAFGVTGIAYRAKLMPVRVLDADGQGNVATIARGIRFAAKRRAKIINMSFEFSIGLTASQIPDVLAAIRYAHKRGALLVAAAGNGEARRVTYPARARQVMAIGATTEHGCIADYSNTGTGLDMVAPGGGSDALILDDPRCETNRSGRNIYQYTFIGSNPRRFGLPSGYEGTSMAVPHVSATAALIVAQRLLGPDPTPDQLEQRLESTARDLGPGGPDSTYGAGLLDSAAATAPLA